MDSSNAYVTNWLGFCPGLGGKRRELIDDHWLVLRRGRKWRFRSGQRRPDALKEDAVGIERRQSTRTMTSPPRAGSGFKVVLLRSLSLVVIFASFAVLLGCLKKSVSDAVSWLR